MIKEHGRAYKNHWRQPPRDPGAYHVNRHAERCRGVAPDKPVSSGGFRDNPLPLKCVAMTKGNAGVECQAAPS